ncbi:MAG: hypothetical protein NTY75_02400 [Candidatus Shapirobacteria bacterium]|nr:hypothetical protein [Candidatus Shapirobacteria bacterium]
MAKNDEPKSWLSSEDLFGKEMEDKFVVALGKLGVPEVLRQLKDNDTREKKSFAISRATEEEDKDGIDFWFYVPRDKNWFPIDLTTTNNPDKLSTKKAKERRTGVKILRLDQKTIDLASKGGENYLEQISLAVGALFAKEG